MRRMPTWYFCRVKQLRRAPLQNYLRFFWRRKLTRSFKLHSLSRMKTKCTSSLHKKTNICSWEVKAKDRCEPFVSATTQSGTTRVKMPASLADHRDKVVVLSHHQSMRRPVRIATISEVASCRLIWHWPQMSFSDCSSCAATHEISHVFQVRRQDRVTSTSGFKYRLSNFRFLCLCPKESHKQRSMTSSRKMRLPKMSTPAQWRDTSFTPSAAS